MINYRTRVSYRLYIASPEWDKRRKVEYGKAKGRCLACGNRAENIHHRTYARLGHEADGDLVALCENCHTLAHIEHVEHPSLGLWEATNALICRNRELFGLPPVSLPTAKEVARSLKRSREDATDRKLRQQVRHAKSRERRQRRDKAQRQKREDRKLLRARLSQSVTADEARSVTCPHCGAMPGAPCEQTGNRPHEHVSRIKRYHEQGGQQDAA